MEAEATFTTYSDPNPTSYLDPEAVIADEEALCPACGANFMTGSVPQIRMGDLENDDQKFTVDLDVKFCISCGVMYGKVTAMAYAGY